TAPLRVIVILPRGDRQAKSTLDSCGPNAHDPPRGPCAEGVERAASRLRTEERIWTAPSDTAGSIRQARPSEVRSPEVGLLEPRPREVGSGQVGPVEGGLAQVGATEGRLDQTGA